MSKSIEQLKESILADLLTNVIDIQNAIEELPVVLEKGLEKYAKALEISENTFSSMKEENELLLKNQSNLALNELKSKIDLEINKTLSNKLQSMNSTAKNKLSTIVIVSIFSLFFGFIGVFSGSLIYKHEREKLEKDSITLMLQDNAINELPTDIRDQISKEYKKQVEKYQLK